MNFATSRKLALAHQQQNKAKAHFVAGRAVTSSQVIESHKESYTGKQGHTQVLSMARNNFPSDVDISWLPAAAVTYQISPNIEDYIVVDVAAVTVDIPNRNLQGFPYEEVTYFDYNHGRMVYQTFVGSPSCMDHANEVDQNPDLAKGVIFAAIMQYVPTFDIYKIRLLQGFDRTKDTKLANDIMSKKRRFYSMGSLVSAFVDPVTGLVEGQPGATKQPKGSVYMGHLIWSMCLGVKYIENSSVEEPADPFAEGNPF